MIPLPKDYKAELEKIAADTLQEFRAANVPLGSAAAGKIFRAADEKDHKLMAIMAADLVQLLEQRKCK